MSEQAKIWVVCPTFFDVSSFLQVREEIRQVFKPSFALIDDSAGQDPDITAKVAPLEDVQVIPTPYNLGHQGALVYGLRTISGMVVKEDIVVTMDSDGEDRPTDVPALIEPLLEHRQNIHRVAIARRTQRTETPAFKVFYAVYKAIFRVLTGTVIRNGNFAAYRGWLLKEVIFHPHFDHCYSSSFISLPLQITMVPLPRARRYGGKSKMGYMGLFTHGLRMLMPFSEKIATRGILASAVVMGLGAVLGRSFLVLFSTLTMGLSILLFATFSQTKARSLRGLNVFERGK